jgi:hypothetical protein
MPAAARGRGTSEKPWREALQLAANEIDKVTKQKKLRRIAQAVVDAAMAGDMVAAKEVGDRLDGKAMQGIEASIDGQLIVKVLERARTNTPA